jgi:hypothetical protein
MISGSELNQLVFIASDDHTVLEEARREWVEANTYILV